MILLALVYHVYAGFRSGKTEIGFAGEQRGHRLFAAAGGRDLHVQSFLLKETERQSDILRRIKDRTGDLVQLERDRIGVCVCAGKRQQGDQDRQQER